jgi:hypothetical protein
MWQTILHPKEKKRVDLQDLPLACSTAHSVGHTAVVLLK